MKFTIEDLMKAMGLKVGDRFEADMGIIKAPFEVRDDFTLLRLDNASTGYELWDIFGLDYKILPQPKRVGDLKCEGECKECPIRAIECLNTKEKWSKTLFEILELWKNRNSIYFDQGIYRILKARLDKEVKDNVD